MALDFLKFSPIIKKQLLKFVVFLIVCLYLFTKVLVVSQGLFLQEIMTLEQYYEEAKELAGFFNQCHAVSTTPLIPVILVK